MYNREKGQLPAGRRCQICVGCGRCPGVGRALGPGRNAMKVVTESCITERGRLPGDLEGWQMAAADIGTTTIAMELLGPEGEVKDSFVTCNPQGEYGADVLSRITCAGDPAVRGRLQDQVRGALLQGAERFLRSVGQKERLVVFAAANTTMSYLFMGWDPGELGRAPFHAGHLSGGGTWLSPRIYVLLLPGLSAFVGGDIWAGIRALRMEEKEELQLLVDLGTNGEIVLGNCDGLTACATAAGPAFEGGPNKGIWGADMVSYAAGLLDRALVDETGLLSEPYFSTGIRVGDVLITQASLRALQCAKAAILAGIRILMETRGIGAESIERVVLAGGFGYYLDPAAAGRIGLIPESLQGKAQAGGNTALAGAGFLGGKWISEKL